MATITKWLKAFGEFWLDFLIGDTPEIFIGTLVIVGSALALRHEHAVALTLIPIEAVVFLAFSTYRGRVRA